MTLRVAHIGNLAQNAYLNARFQREYTDIEADSFDYGDDLNWTPLWEDGDFDWTRLPTMAWDSDRIGCRNGWVRPPWAKILGRNHGPAWFDTLAEHDTWRRLQRDTVGRVCWPLYALGRGECVGGQWPLPTSPDHRTPDPASLQQFWVPVFTGEDTTAVRQSVLADLPELPYWQSVRALARHYDLLVLYGPEAASGVTLPRGTPYVTFEHATMRHVPAQASPLQRLLARAYRWASQNIITNADCVRAAQALGLTRYRFLPHPVDTEKFSPQPTARAAALRATILAHEEAELLFLSPTRQSSDQQSGLKGNEVLLHAYARYVREAETAGAPRAVLLLAVWGNALDESHALCAELGIAGRVLWCPMLPKTQLADLYRAADVVCDQFARDVGSFGTTTVEGLASGKTVVTYIDPVVHEWCADVLPAPPVCNAHTVEEVFGYLWNLALSPVYQQVCSQQGREWVEQWHSPRRVAELHQALYKEVLAA